MEQIALVPVAACTKGIVGGTSGSFFEGPFVVDDWVQEAPVLEEGRAFVGRTSPKANSWRLIASTESGFTPGTGTPGIVKTALLADLMAEIPVRLNAPARRRLSKVDRIRAA